MAPGEGVTIRPGSDYAQINSTLWKFFYGTYGGGPEIVLRGNPANDAMVRSNSVSGSSAAASIKEHDERIVADAMADTQPNDGASQAETNGIGQSTAINGQALHSKQNAAEDNPMPPMVQPQSIDEQTMNGDGSRSAPAQVKPPSSPAPSSPAHAPTPPAATATTKKPAKYVSFEDNDSSTSSDRDTSSTNDHLHMRRGKHNYSTSPANSWEILSKKDRRHRSIQSNGFFGAEGK